MAYIQVEGGNPLKGSLVVQGAKNAVLPVLSAALLHKGTTELSYPGGGAFVRQSAAADGRTDAFFLFAGWGDVGQRGQAGDVLSRRLYDWSKTD